MNLRIPATACLVLMSACVTPSEPMATKPKPQNPVVRVSRGRFDPAKHDEVAAKLDASRIELIPAIQRLPGMIDYYVGIDRDSGTMVNVSVWETEEHARQMRTLAPMLALKTVFESSGVTFEPIVNYATL